MRNFFEGHGFVLKGILHLSPQESYKLCLSGALLLDVRLGLLFKQKRFDVPELLHCHSEEIGDFFHHLPSNKPIIVADAVGIHSKEVVAFLLEKGYTMVANLVGGIHDWERDGLPLIINKDETMTGGCMCMLRTWGKTNANNNKKPPSIK